MSRINQIIEAANQTGEYIELMRLPEKSQGFSNYSTLSLKGGKPKLENTGFTMMSPTQSKIDKGLSFSSGYIFGPLVLAKGIMDRKNTSGIMSETLNYGTIAAGSIWTILGIYKSICYSKSETLVFPRNR
jgi:hypothetical protein